MQKKDLNGGRVNGMIGTALGFGFVTPKQIPFAGGILVLCLPFIFALSFPGTDYLYCHLWAFLAAYWERSQPIF